MGPYYKNGEKPYLKCTMIGLATIPIQELKTKILFILSYSCCFFNNDYDLNSTKLPPKKQLKLLHMKK